MWQDLLDVKDLLEDMRRKQQGAPSDITEEYLRGHFVYMLMSKCATQPEYHQMVRAVFEVVAGFTPPAKGTQQDEGKGKSEVKIPSGGEGAGDGAREPRKRRACLEMQAQQILHRASSKEEDTATTAASTKNGTKTTHMDNSNSATDDLAMDLRVGVGRGATTADLKFKYI